MNKLVVRCVQSTVEDAKQRIDKRLIALESISAECGALLSKVSIKQYRASDNYGTRVICKPSRTLLTV